MTSLATPASLTPLAKAPHPATPRTEDTNQVARKLNVGHEIVLSGEIRSCEILAVEGTVNANITGCRELQIAKSGLFKGSAAVENAEISGRFEGELTVSGRLFIRAGGKVTASVRYHQIEIECGGQIAGDIQAQG